MNGLCQDGRSACKRQFRARAYSWRRGRDRWREKHRRQRAEHEQERKQFRKELRRCQRQRDRLQRRVDEFEAEKQAEQESRRREQAAPATQVVFEDPPVGSHGYGPRTIDLAIRLVQNGVALQATPRAMAAHFKTFEIKAKIPSYWTVRLWMQRFGCGQLTAPIEKADDWIWLVDHSVQLGQEKLLVVLAVRAAHLPPPGTALRLENLHPIVVLPCVVSNKESVRDQLKQAIKERGLPRAIVSDHGSDLLGGIQLLRLEYPTLIELYDFKHFAACRFKALVEHNERFHEFQRLASNTRKEIQQTGMSFLAPPSPKSKARYMNFGPTFAWAAKMLRLLELRRPKTLQWVKRHKLEEKLGWLREFRDDVAQWRECQTTIDAGVKFINQQGIFRGAAKPFRAALPADLKHPVSRRLAEQLVEFIAAESAKLKTGERLSLSTEIVESSFGKFKYFQGDQQAKQGFTTLIIAFAALLVRVTPQRVSATFAITSVRDVRTWLKEKLKTTPAAKRIIAYRECRPPKSAPKSLKFK